VTVLSPREALKKLLGIFDEIESSRCQLCVPADEVTSECPKHDRRWKRALQEARSALAYSNN
jgi:hypothetical protein